jgi:hypothetical protein
MFKYYIVSLILPILIIGLTACNRTHTVNEGSDQVTSPSMPKESLLQLATSLKTKKACEAENGIWKKAGRIQSFSCTLPTTDAGKACTNKNQCQVACVAQGKNIQSGTNVVGRCHNSTDQFGCRTYVRNGKAEPALCID